MLLKPEAKLYKGNCLDIVPSLSGKIHAIIADLPYGKTACDWDSIINIDLFWRVVECICKHESPILLFGCEPFTSLLVASNINNFRYTIIWEKDKASNFACAKIVPLRYHEEIVVFYKTPVYNPQMWISNKVSNKPGVNGGMSNSSNQDVYGRKTPLPTVYRNSRTRYPKSIIRFNTIKHNDNEYCNHPTQKPVALLEYLIKTYTNPGDTVLDPTMGSGTTGIACMNLDRNFIGIELDDNYFEMAQDRIMKAREKPKQLSMFEE